MPERYRYHEPHYPTILKRRRFREPIPQEQSDKREGIAFQKKYDWEARKRILVKEVLDASDASEAEKAFLLGSTDEDPSPLHEIEFRDLVPSDEIIEIPEEIDVHAPLYPPTRLPHDHRSLRERVFSLLNETSAEASGSMWKQASFHSRAHLAFVDAFNASNASLDESEFLLGMRNDPHPNHSIIYHRLVPAPVHDPIPLDELVE